jgi:O-methyltransferase involved in polyketide biosynthesis
VDFDTTGQLLFIYSGFLKYLKKWEYSEELQQIFADFRKAYDSIRRVALVSHSHRIWYPHDTATANKNVSE